MDCSFGQTEDQEKRYRYLLGDSELFDRFIDAKRLGKSPLEVLTQHASTPHSRAEEYRAPYPCLWSLIITIIVCAS